VEMPAQLVADLEIGGDRPATTTKEKRDTRKLNTEVKEFQPRRSERKAKETAPNRVVGIALNELEED
jgi:hypothetical protein